VRKAAVLAKAGPPSLAAPATDEARPSYRIPLLRFASPAPLPGAEAFDRGVLALAGALLLLAALGAGVLAALVHRGLQGQAA
jgi:hypothetical protein